MLLPFLLIALALPPQEQVGTRRSRIDYQVDPLVDLYFLVRACAAGVEPTVELAGLDEATAAVRSLDGHFGNPLGWGLLDARLEGCTAATELLDAFEALPAEGRSLGRTFPLRDPAVALAEAVATLEEEYLESVWPLHQDALQAALDRIAQDFRPHEQACFDHVLDSFAMDDPGLEIPVFLVAQAPPPGGVTYFRASGPGGVCFVGIDQPGSQLYEVVLHEAMHALDAGTRASGSVLQELRGDLAQAGLPATSPRIRNLWHTLMFVQAAATIGRFVAGDHRPYGEVSGYYARVPDAAAIEIPIWTAYLAGEFERGEAIERIVTEGTRKR